MKTSANHAFVNQFVIGLLVAIGFGGSVGLGTVWLRHQISVVADANRALEQQCRDIERRTAELGAEIESAMSNPVLRQQNESMRLGLVELNRIPILPVPVDPISRLVARANRRVFEREGTSGGPGIQIDLSLPTLPANAQTTRPAPAARAVTSPVHSNAFFVRGTREQFATNP